MTSKELAKFIAEVHLALSRYGKAAMNDYLDASKHDGLTPGRSDYLLQVLSGYSYNLNTELSRLETEEIEWKEENQANSSSEAELNRLWDQTDGGKELKRVKRMYKSVDNILIALRHRLKRLQTESYNNS